MGLMDALRKAEKKGTDVVRRGKEAVHETSDDEAQRRARQKMRVYPPQSGVPAQNQTEQNATERELEDARRKAIVSVNGEDVDENDIGKGRKIA